MCVSVGCALVMLLQNPDLLPRPTQRLTAAVMLLDLNRNESVASSPFVTVFVHLLVSPLHSEIFNTLNPYCKSQMHFSSDSIHLMK